MIFYLDTSALVKRYVREEGTTEVLGLIEMAEHFGTVELTHVEMAATLAKASRLNWVEKSDAEKAWGDFLEHWHFFTRLAVTPAILDRASRLAWEQGLRGYDAIHCAAALTWQETLETAITLATFDRELWTAAKKKGMAVWPKAI